VSVTTLKKVTLFGLTGEKESILDKMQSMGCMHLIALAEKSTVHEPIDIGRHEEVCKALKYMQSCPKKRHQVLDDQTFDLNQCIDRVLHNQRRLINIENQYKFLRQRISVMEPWGDFHLPKIEEIGGFRFWFYRVPVGKIKKVLAKNLIWQIVYRDLRYVYIVVLSKDGPPFDAMPVPRLHLGSIPLSQLRKLMDDILLEIEDLRAERESLTRWIFMIGKNLAHTENIASLTRAKGQTIDRDGIFFVQAWLPCRSLERLVTFTKNQHLALMAEDPAANELPPTLLENPKLLSGAEDLVNFYQTPGYYSCDPSIVLFFSFSLFFAMIIGDAGYAFLLGLGLLVFWRPLRRTELYRRMYNLAFAVIIASIIWGALMGSYFGISPPSASLMAWLKIFDIHDTKAMMKLSITIGIVHLIMANGCKAWHCRGRSIALVPLGWIAVIIGGDILWSSQRVSGFAINLSTAGWVILGCGLFTVFLFSSDRTIRQPVDLLWKILDGAKGITKLSKIFGDLLSYLRLFALGLASSSLALIFNHNAAHALRAQTGMNILTCLLIWITGHSLNLLMCLMSGIVHGLRLNFIEYFAWSVSEEGYSFKTFSKKDVHE